MNKTVLLFLSVMLLAATASFANIAAVDSDDMQLAFGVSYHLNGADITNLKVPMMLNRIGGHGTYSPIRYVNVGIDAGLVLLSVDKFAASAGGASDTVPVFDGKVGLSAGGHLKLTTPYMFDYVGMTATGNANYFHSANDMKAYYAGIEIAAAIGLQVRIPDVGSVSFGPQLYLIDGKNKGYDGVKGTYSNVNNLRVWIAFDYFPEIDMFAEDQRPYLTIEFTASPEINGSKRVPVREFGLAVIVGMATLRR